MPRRGTRLALAFGHVHLSAQDRGPPRTRDDDRIMSACVDAVALDVDSALPH